MFRRSSGSEDSGDYNWRRLWETPSRKSQRRYARAWVHPLLSDLPLPEVLVVPVHPTRPSEFIAMSSNPANQPIGDHFIRWRQEMEAKQEEQARQMAELREHANHLQKENARLRTRLETNRAENPQGATQHVPLTQINRAKNPPYLTIVIHQQMTSYLPIALYSPVVCHHRTMRKPSPERDLLAILAGLLVARVAE